MKNKRYLRLVCVLLILSLTMTACSAPVEETTSTVDGIAVKDGDYAAAIESAQVGDIFLLGAYEQDNNEKNGKEPVQWRVLDKNEKGILLLSEYILDYMQFAYDARTATWDTSALRESWGVGRLDRIFDRETIMHIRWTYLSNPGNPQYEVDGGVDTVDKLFLLSYEEVNKYLADSAARSTTETKAANSSLVSDSEKNAWWLRTPGDTDENAMFVSSDGTVSVEGKAVGVYDLGVRPAMWLMKNEQADIYGPKKLDYTQLEDAEIGNVVLLGNYDIDDDLSNKEPIEWIVLSKKDDKLLLLSRYIIEKKEFGVSPEWDGSSLRTWLNTDFYGSAFNDEERAKMQRVITSDKTDDLIFLLSSEEARFFFTSDPLRMAHITPYLQAKKFKDYYYNMGNWWTRSVSAALNGQGVVNISPTGEIQTAGTNPRAPEQYTYVDIGVRPVICISLTEPQLEAMNMDVFGINSDHDLDNEIKPSVKVCAICNGTGYVKYYYGSSDLQALLDGYDPYTVGKCTSCGGTGRD